MPVDKGQDQGTEDQGDSQSRFVEYVRAGPFEIGVVDLADQMIAQEDDENGQQPGRQDGS